MKKIPTLCINGKEIDEEGYFRSVEFWTKEDGSIKMNIADEFGKDNLIILLKTALKELDSK